MKYIFFCLLSLALWGCRNKKEDTTDIVVPPPPAEWECIEIGDAPGPFEWWITVPADTLPNYYLPCYNPNNANEFIFTSGSLYKYNLVTHEKTLVYEGQQIFPAKWGSNGWILLNLSDANVWKIRPDGTELTQLTYSGADYYPVWNIDGTVFAATRDFNGWYRTILYNELGEHLDTLSLAAVGPSTGWLHPIYTVSMTLSGPKVFDLYGDSLVYSQQGVFSGVSVAQWINEHEFVWAYEDGIFRTNYVTGQTIQIKESCDARIYRSVTYHPVSNKLIWSRTDLKHLHNDVLEGKTRLYMMNTDGTGEVEIVIE